MLTWLYKDVYRQNQGRSNSGSGIKWGWLTTSAEDIIKASLAWQCALGVDYKTTETKMAAPVTQFLK